MGIDVGGAQVGVDLPMDHLQRFQLQGGEAWPEGEGFRIRTTHGDAFFVAAETTPLVIDNALGTFAPFLSECASVRPLADTTGEWRIELDSGTVLIGPMESAEIEFALAMGPTRATVPLDRLVGMDRQYWDPWAAEQGKAIAAKKPMMDLPSPAASPPAVDVVAELAAMDTGEAEATALAGEPARPDSQRQLRVPHPSPRGWYTRDAIQSYKSTH